MECPICKEFDEKDHFSCPNCSRDNICGSHYNFDHLVCSECAEKMDPPKPKKKAPKKDAGAVDAGEAVEVEVPEDYVDPFYYHKLKCPVCANESEQRWFKAKTYSERNVDVDKHPQGYMWAEKGCEHLNPPLFYIWHCPNCHFANPYVDYENPLKDPYSNFRDLKDIFVDKYHDDPRVEKIIDKLGENIDYDKINHYQAIKLHLLAIFIQELIEDDEEKDSFKIGRLYLRLGWLYRELNQSQESSTKIIKTLAKLSEFLKKGWTKVATDEASALEKAIENLNLAFRYSNAIKSISAEIDMLLLIAGIYLKLDNTEEALRSYNTVLSRGQKSKQKIEERIKKAGSTMPDDEVKRFDTQIKKIDSLMGKARDIMSDLKAEKMKEEKKKAAAIMKGLEGKQPLEIREILVKKGIDKSLAMKLTPEQKKKFLGLF